MTKEERTLINNSSGNVLNYPIIAKNTHPINFIKMLRIMSYKEVLKLISKRCNLS